MPSASASAGRSRRARPRRASGPRRAGAGRASSAGAALALAPARVRWDRVGRFALLCVLAALVYLYVSAGVRLFSSWRQSNRAGVAVQQLQREHTRLLITREHLSGQAALEAQARQLGMLRPGEQPYVVSGLPSN